MHYLLISFLLFASIGISEAATTVTVNLRDGSGNAITSGATLKFADGLGWHTATNNNDGTFTASVDGTNINYTMSYNTGAQTKTVASTTTTVDFQTTTTTISLENSATTPLGGGTFKHAQSSWSGNIAANSSVELLPGTYKFVMSYNTGAQTIENVSITGTTADVTFTTVATTVSLENTAETALTGGTFKHAQGSWSADVAANTSVELLPGTYKFVMSYHTGSQAIENVTVPTNNNEVTFTTVAVTTKLVDCDNNELPDGSYTYAQNSWSGNNTANTPVELLPGTYKFVMNYNHASQTQTGIAVSGTSQEVVFSTTQINYIYGGNVQFAQGSWGTYTQGMHFLPGTYKFVFGNITYPTFAVSGCTMDGNLNIFQVKKHDGTPLPGVKIERNHTSIYYTNVGTTDANGMIFSTDQPAGSWKYRATKDYSTQYIISSPNNITFQTSEFVTHVTKHDGSDLAGVQTQYNQTSIYYMALSPSVTDANGKASIELFPGEYNFKATKDYSTQVKSLEITTPGTSKTVEFQTSEFVTHVSKHDGSDFAGVQTQYNQSSIYYMALSSNVTDANGKASIELFPGNYKFKATKDYSTQIKMLEIPTSGDSKTVEFQTNLAEAHVKDCDLNTGVAGVNVQYNQSSIYYMNLNVSSTDASGIASIELFPGTYKFKATINYSKQEQIVDVNNSITTFDFNPTRLDYNYDGVIKYNTTSIYWSTITPGTYLFPGTYNFKFGTESFPAFEIAGCTMGGNLNIFRTVKHDGTPLPGVKIERNHYYSSYTNVGTTDANGLLFSTDQPAGSWKYKATKDNSYQYITSTPNNIKFQTSEFVTNVMHTDGTPYEGIKTEYNHYYSSYMDLSPSVTDANGHASIELFPGNYKFKATKNNSIQVKELSIANPGMSATVDFQTSTFVTHVMDHIGNAYAGIKTEYNHYYSSYMDLSPSTTDANGNASIELFPGNYKFKATKDNSTQVKMFEIATSGVTASVDFQTGLAEAHVKDCDLNTGVAGVAVQYNHYYSSYMGLNPSTTGANGIASIELFPGSHKFKATILNTEQVLVVDILDPITNPITTFEFNPTRVTFNYPGTVQYNHYYSSYMTIGANTYLFPGTYNFRFYNGNTLTTQKSIAISGCKQEGSLIFVQLQNSSNAGLANGDFKYRIGWGTYSPLGTDATGNGMWTFVDGNPTNTKVTVTYAGAEVEKQQNIKTNPVFIFNTVDITADLRNSNGGLLTADTWEYRYGWGAYTPLTAAGHELLPVNTKVKVGYKGAEVEMQQNAATNSQFDFATKSVKAELKSSTNVSLDADTWEYRYGWGAYSTLNNLGEELLPVNVKVKVGYAGSELEKQQNVATTPNYVFNTTNVTAELLSSTNSALTADKYEYRYGWGTYTDLPSGGAELLPVTVKVKATYAGACVEKQQNIGSTPHYVFNTVNVIADLKSSTGDDLTTSDWQYRYGWGAYSPLTNTGHELLPVNTKVKVTYKGACVEKEQNLVSNSNFNFVTKKVTADLKDAGNNSIAANAWDYRYGWGAYSTLNPAGEELLPVSVKVRATYNSKTKEKEQNIASNSSYLFNWNGTSLYKSVNDYDFTAEKVNVYPNPSDGRFMIENVNNYFRLSIYDMTGRVVYQSDINDVNKQNITMDNPVPGAYMIQLEGIGTTVTTPIMIK